jgi:UDP-sugar pyrophosphorylase
VPIGTTLGSPFSDVYTHFEGIGLREIGSCGFVLVAGGLGERLGYSGIKVGLPSETLTNTSYLHLYCKQLLAIQTRYAPPERKIPLAIMVSDDTLTRTEELLVENNYFGMSKEQVTLLKQEKVAALLDNDAKMALSEKYVIDSKPHGHGDVHSLMYSSLTARKWLYSGIKWVAFIQDTNGLSLYTLPAMLGVSVERDFEVNSLAIPRKAKQAVGALAKLRHTDGREMTLNVEYNQLDPLLRATISPDGDVNNPSTGLSDFPGNINMLLFRLEPYVANLNRTCGVMGEFVNPKYADKEKTVFKKPTRLECMMQDYPKELENSSTLCTASAQKVGFTMAAPWMCYSPCKNNTSDAAASLASGIPPASAASAEADQYFYPGEILRQLGASIPSNPIQHFLGIPVSLGPKIVFDPSFAFFPCEIKARFPSPELVSLTPSSSLVIDGNVVVESLKLDGAMRLTVESERSKLVVRSGHMVIWNSGYAVRKSRSIFHCLNGEVSETVFMRGYSLHKVAEEVVVARGGQEIIFTGKAVVAAVGLALNSGALGLGGEQESDETSCSETDTCGGCLLSTLFKCLLLQP